MTHAVEKLVQTTLRSILGDMGLDDTLASREEVIRTLMQKISNVCLNWGLQITAVELLEIIPSPTIQDAMHKQLAAERIRRAAIVTADGQREQAKTQGLRKDFPFNQIAFILRKKLLKLSFGQQYDTKLFIFNLSLMNSGGRSTIHDCSCKR